MIYDIHWTYAKLDRTVAATPFGGNPFKRAGLSVEDEDTFSPRRVLAGLIKQSKDSSFVFAINVDNYGGGGGTAETEFKNWLKECQLEDLLVHTTDYGITNEYHAPRGIKLHVLMTKDHWYRELAKDDPEITEENFINYVNWPENEDQVSEAGV